MERCGPSKPPVSLEAGMACATIVNNAAASSSCETLDLPLAPLLEHIATPTLANYTEHATCQKAKRKTRWGAKKGKKDSVHMTPLDPSLKGNNIIIFADAEEQVSNPIDAGSGETLFIPNPQEYNHNNVKVNPKHPRASFYWLLMDCYKQNPSGKSSKWIIDPYLDASSDGEQDSSDEEMGCSPQLFIPPWDKETIKDHWEDYELDAQHDSHMNDDYSYWRYVSNFDINTVADRQQLLVALAVV